MPMSFTRLLADLSTKLPRTKEEFLALGLDIWWDENEGSGVTEGRAYNLVFSDMIGISLYVSFQRLPFSERHPAAGTFRPYISMSSGRSSAHPPPLRIFEQIFGPYTERTPLDGTKWIARWEKGTMNIFVEVHEATQTVRYTSIKYPEEYIPR